MPKSIDNDILFIDQTFGFSTAVTAASSIITNAWVEATSCERGVGIVKLLSDTFRSGRMFRGLLPGLARSTIANGSGMVALKKTEAYLRETFPDE